MKKEIGLMLLAFTFGVLSSIAAWQLNHRPPQAGETAPIGKPVIRPRSEYDELEDILADVRFNNALLEEQNNRINSKNITLRERLVHSGFNNLPISSVSPFPESKVYTNTKYGYSFRYPADRIAHSGIKPGTDYGGEDSKDSIEDALLPAQPDSEYVAITENEAMIFCCEPFSLTFSVKPPDFDADAYFRENYDYAYAETLGYGTTTEIVFDGYPALVYWGPTGFAAPDMAFAVSRSDHTLFIQLWDADVLYDTLSTFTFTR